MLRSCHTLVAVIIALLSFLVFVSFSYNADAVTVITVDNEASCESLPLSGGTATWDGSTNTCVIPEGATLQIKADQVLDMHVSLSVSSSFDGTEPVAVLRNLQGGTINILATGRLYSEGELSNFGTINILDGGILNLVLGDFHNGPTGIVNNYDRISTSGPGGPGSRINDGTINNYAGAIFSLSEDGGVANNAQGVINNHGLIERFVDGLSTGGIVNNYGIITDGAVSTVPGGILNNFGTIEIPQRGFTDEPLFNQGTLSNHGVITNTGGSGSFTGIINTGTIINRGAGAIENIFGDFKNSGSINNLGVISNYCGGIFTNTGTFTGNPVKNACDEVSPAITAPADVILTTTGTRLNVCQNIPVSGISAIGDDGAGNVAANTLDNNLGTRWSHGGAASWIRPDLGSTKVICSVDIAWYQGNLRVYNFVISVSNDGVNFKRVFTGHSSGTTLSPEKYAFADFVGRYVKITVNANSVNTFASITEIDVGGYTSLGLPVFSDNKDPFPLVKNNVPANGLPVGSNTVTWTTTDANGNGKSDAQLVKVVAGDTTLPTIAITSPKTGSTVTGPANAVKVSLSGTAADSGSGIQKVELKSLKGGVAVHAYQQATPGAPNNWGTWSHTLTFTQTGTYSITARATDKAGNQNWYTVTVTIAFSASDTTRPALSITSPATGSTIAGPTNDVNVSLKGTASDSGSGVQKVELKSLKGNVEVHAYQLATPNVPGNWASWSHTLTFAQTGTYTITARATDNAGNQNWYSITVTIAFGTDTIIPTVSITSPQTGASFSGPTSPKVIRLAGIAADSGSGVQKVEIKSLKNSVEVHSYQEASTSTNWAKWAHTLDYSQAGTYTITARVTDKAGIQNWYSITVNISFT